MSPKNYLYFPEKFIWLQNAIYVYIKDKQITNALKFNTLFYNWVHGNIFHVCN